MQSIVLKQHTNTLPMMHPSNRLGKHLPNLQHLQLRTLALVLLLRHRVRYNNLIQRALIDPLAGIAREDTVRDERIDGVRARLLQQLRGAGDGVRGVRQIVHEYRRPVRHVPDEEQGSALAVVSLRWSPLLFDMI